MTEDTTEPIEPEIVEPDAPALPPTANKGIPLNMIKKYHDMGLSQGDIAKLLGCSKSTIQWHLKTLGIAAKTTEAYTENRAGWFDSGAASALLAYSALTPEERKKGIGYRLALEAGIMYDKSESARCGRAPVNNINILIMDANRIKARIEELENELENL